MEKSSIPDLCAIRHHERVQQNFIQDTMKRALQNTKGISRRHSATGADADWDATERESLSVCTMNPV